MPIFSFDPAQLKRAAAAVLAVFCVLLLPCVGVACGAYLPSVYGDTYYGELPHMLKRLETEKPKIIVVGGSGIAFGLRTDLMQQEFPDRSVVAFGLYGAIGVEAMLELTKAELKEGDIVIIAPEQNEQSLSGFFSAENLWRGLDGDPSGFLRTSGGDLAAMIESYPSFLHEKVGYLKAGGQPQGSGVYQQQSFNDAQGNETGHMTYPRPWNIMLDGYDPETIIRYSTEVGGTDLVAYITDYTAYAQRKGARVLFGFAPANRLALDPDTTEETVQSYYDALYESLPCEIVGYPGNYIFDYEWFYDNNFHLNSSGMYLYTYQLTEDIKTALDDSSQTSIPSVEKPVIPATAPGDEEDEMGHSYFVFQAGEAYAEVVGLTVSGSEQSRLAIPEAYQGKPVRSISSGAFSAGKQLVEIQIPPSVTRIENGAFEGCEKLLRVLLSLNAPEECTVGEGLLSGADNCWLYVPEESLSSFMGGCSGWSYFADRMAGYSSSG